jgi:hypothetical protein
VRKSEEYEFPQTAERDGPAIEAVVVTVPEGIKADALALISRASGLVVRNQDDLDGANDYLAEIKRRIEYFSGLYDPQIAKANALHKGLLFDKKQFTDPLERAAKVIGPKIADYLWEEDQRRLAAARARQLAEEKAAREAEKAADKAHELIANGQEGKVAAVVQKAAEKIEAIKATAPVVPDKPEADFSLRETWAFEITDAALIPRKYLLIDEVTIGKIVRAMKDQTDIPGVRAYTVRSVAAKASKY